MRHTTIRFATTSNCLLAVAVICATLPSCTTPARHANTIPRNHRGDGVWNDPAGPAKKTHEANRMDTVKEVSQNQAQRLADALEHRSFTESSPPITPSNVQWIETTDPLIAHAKAPTKTRNSGSRPSKQPATPKTPRQANPSQSFAQEWSKQDMPPDRKKLLSQLRRVIRSGGDDELDKAIATIGLSLADPNRILNEKDLEPLNPKHRTSIRQYHKILVALAEQLVTEDRQIDIDSVVDQMDEAFKDRPIRIKKVELCQRVRGYGVYEPFENHVFLSGREQPMIVYAELSNFHHQKNSESRYQVKLAQEVVLYNEADGLAVWRQPTVDIVDESRNRRHDFFVVQMIRLPARLSVGKYLMKVRITDSGSGSLDESTIPLQIVADQSMVTGKRP